MTGHTYNAVATRVIDGDTFVAQVDLGFYASIQINVRLHGVDAPERDKPGGMEATNYLKELIEGKSVVIETYHDRLSFTRWIADVACGSVVVSAAIISAGHGVPFDPRTDHWTR